MTLPEIIKITRQKAFMTQDEFAKEMNVSSLTVNRWENGKTKPNLTAMKRMKQFCEKNNFSYSPIENAWFGRDIGEELQ